MAEEHRYEQSTAPRLCANNCGFFGSPATLDLCSKCYRDHCIKEQQRQEMEKLLTKASPTASFSPSSSSSSVLGAAASEVQSGIVSAIDAAAVNSSPASGAAASDRTASSGGPTRCGACRKRVGLTGFKCRCGVTFCGAHRYAEQHACTFDFKAAGKDAIARANPVVKADKLDRI